MSIYKIGATLQIVLEFTEEEFDSIYPFDSFLAECENSSKEYTLNYTIDVENRTILLSRETDDFTRGTYKVDIRIEKDGLTTFFPKDSYITFQMIPPVSEPANQVNTNVG